MSKEKKVTKNAGKGDLDHLAYMGIRKMLFYNEIMPGQKITYQDLANRLGVSITPVIHALKWLEYRDIVTHESNKGYLVNEISLQEIKEIYDTRLLLEVSLVPESLKNLDEDGIRRVQKSLEAHNEVFKETDYYKRLMTDMKFHHTIASLSQCRIQLKILQELFDLLLLKYSRSLAIFSMMDISQQEHQKIFESLQTRELQMVKKALSDHLLSVKENILEGFSRMEVNKRENIVV